MAEVFDRAAAAEAALGGRAPVVHGSKDAGRHFDTARHHVEASRGERLERQDGTGRAHETKRGGGGKGNWGTAADQDVDGEVLRAEEAEHDAGPNVFTPADLVDNDKVKTLDEYEQEKAQKATK